MSSYLALGGAANSIQLNPPAPGNWFLLSYITVPNSTKWYPMKTICLDRRGHGIKPERWGGRSQGPAGVMVKVVAPASDRLAGAGEEMDCG